MKKIKIFQLNNPLRKLRGSSVVLQAQVIEHKTGIDRRGRHYFILCVKDNSGHYKIRNNIYFYNALLMEGLRCFEEGHLISISGIIKEDFGQKYLVFKVLKIQRV